MSIPKIIHHIAPKDKSSWHPLWEECKHSWIKNFKDFKFFYWDDDDLDLFIKTKFANYYKTYKKFPKNILRYDFARICLLYEFGGIYADMDFYCYKNFFNELKFNICILGDKHVDSFYSSNRISNVTVGNSLMCSTSKQLFWIKCIDKMILLYDYYQKRNIFEHDINLFIANNRNERMGAYAVLKMGSENIAEVINGNLESYLNTIQFLPSSHYDSDYLEYKEDFFTKHLYTGSWDQQYIESTDKKKFANEHYKLLRNVDIDFIKLNILR